jgi:recombination protein RecT
MSNQLAVIKDICGTLDNMGNQIKSALPHGMDVNRFISTAKTGIQTHPQADKLAQADKRTLYASCLKAASDGLTLDGREAALVVFANNVTYMPMTQGLVKLARNSGEIANITAEVVYANDKFTFRVGMDEVPVHEPDWFGNRGEAVGVWCSVKLTGGENIVRILSKEKILKIAGKTKNAAQYDPKNGLYFDEFWRKTAIKNVLKYAPKSTYLESAMRNDNEAQGFTFENTEQAPQEVKTTTRAASRIKSIIAEETQQDEAVEGEFTEAPPITDADMPFDDDI